jgi:maleate cis-trans isomerase
VEATVVHTSIGEDAHTVEALSDMGSIPRLLEGASELSKRRPEAVVWSSTSASFVLGRDGAEYQANRLTDALNIPASTTALAFLEALTTLDLRRVAVAATYPEDIARRFVEFLGTAGVEVLQVASKGIFTAAEVGRLEEGEVLRLASENDHLEAEALLIPDTALHTAACLEELEELVEKPVLTANQVTFWEALRLTNSLTPQRGLGKLFHG